MPDNLIFNDSSYNVRTCTLDEYTITYREYSGISYCTRPADAIQTLNLYVPEQYYASEMINGYTLKSAPIFLYNTSSGYMQGAPGEPDKDFFTTRNGFFEALRHGYVVAAPGTRGRTSRTGDKFTGKAPAMIVDLKAVIRYLRFNKDRIPGDTDHIILNGTSAGGALSALAATSANHEDFDPYLTEIGAAEASDEIFAACCYCPIHNLEHADSAYEWMYKGITKVDELIYDFDFQHKPLLLKNITSSEKPLSDEQLQLSAELGGMFGEYVNSLGLKDDGGNELTILPDGSGSFRDELQRYILNSVQDELDTGKYRNNFSYLQHYAPQEKDISRAGCFEIEDGRITGMDWQAFVSSICRSKSVPAFDDLLLKSSENEAFGSEDAMARHFTAFSQLHTQEEAGTAPEEIVNMMNPVYYIGKAPDLAKHWWIRHSIHDSATSLAIPFILAVRLKNAGCNVDFSFPWGLPHCGDYDLETFFQWADHIILDK